MGPDNLSSHHISEATAIRVQARTVAKHTAIAWGLATGVNNRGFSTKMNGTMKATIENRIDITAILSGFAPEIAADRKSVV